MVLDSAEMRQEYLRFRRVLGRFCLLCAVMAVAMLVLVLVRSDAWRLIWLLDGVLWGFVVFTGAELTAMTVADRGWRRR